MFFYGIFWACIGLGSMIFNGEAFRLVFTDIYNAEFLHYAGVIGSVYVCFRGLSIVDKSIKFADVSDRALDAAILETFYEQDSTFLGLDAEEREIFKQGAEFSIEVMKKTIIN